MRARAGMGLSSRKVDVRLPGECNSNSRGARPIHLIITMKEWIRTSRVSIRDFLSGTLRRHLGQRRDPHSQSRRAHYWEMGRAPAVLKATVEVWLGHMVVPSKLTPIPRPAGILVNGATLTARGAVRITGNSAGSAGGFFSSTGARACVRLILDGQSCPKAVS